MYDVHSVLMSCAVSSGTSTATSVTCISPRSFRLTRAKTSAAHTSQPTRPVTITNIGVLTTTSAACSATLTCDVTTSLVTPANCTADTTNQEHDGRSTIHTIGRLTRDAIIIYDCTTIRLFRSRIAVAVLQNKKIELDPISADKRQRQIF